MDRTAPSDPLRVCDLMTSGVHTVRPTDPLSAVVDLMLERRIRHVPVVDDRGRSIGLITQRDLLRHRLIEQSSTSARVEKALLEGLGAEDLMQTRLRTVERDTDLRSAARILFEEKIGCLPVVEEGILVGILTEADFVRFFA